MQTLVQNIKTSGDRLLETINTTRPKLDECILEAEKFDVKEHVKDSMKEDEQQTLLSKSVIPANHRKNMKKLKKARKLLDDVSLEAEAILGLISHVVAMAATGKDEEPKKVCFRKDVLLLISLADPLKCFRVLTYRLMYQ